MDEAGGIKYKRIIASQEKGPLRLEVLLSKAPAPVAGFQICDGFFAEAIIKEFRCGFSG